jgi:hypothetical protein
MATDSIGKARHRTPSHLVERVETSLTVIQAGCVELETDAVGAGFLRKVRAHRASETQLIRDRFRRQAMKYPSAPLILRFGPT